MPYGVALTFTLDAIYTTRMSEGVQLAVQNGFMIKFANDVKWEMMRSSNGKLLAVSHFRNSTKHELHQHSFVERS